MSYDFSGYATRNNIKCTDGRTILANAFADDNGKSVPIVWNHNHSDPTCVLGTAVLENRSDGVYAYGTFNHSESGLAAKELVKNGDIKALSICANRLKQDNAKNVIHGNIREVSLVLAGANSGAYIDNVLIHSDGSESFMDEGYICMVGPEDSILFHSDETKEEPDVAEEKNKKEKTVGDVLATLNEEQKTAVDYLIGEAMNAGADEDDDDDENEGEEMKHNVFYNNDYDDDTILTHADELDIIELAKDTTVGTLQKAMKIYADDHLQHSFEDMSALFPDWHDTNSKGAPTPLTDESLGWVTTVMNGVSKSPFSRIRTRWANLTKEALEEATGSMRGRGYAKGKEKKQMGVIKLLKRTTDPQTVYVKEKLDRDDIIDITDFNVVSYMNSIMDDRLKLELAQAIIIGDGREEDEDDKINEEHIRSILNDDELYAMHHPVDFEAYKAELQGTDTSKHFGFDNYVFAEAIITEILYAREKFNGSGTPTLFCPTHTVNRMLLARDMNGRRIYSTVSELTSALNVGKIESVDRMAGLKRTDKNGKEHEVYGILVNLNDYTVGTTKGGEITDFTDFDIDFNQYTYLKETRLSGALTRPRAAIILESPAIETTKPGGGSGPAGVPTSDQ